MYMVHVCFYVSCSVCEGGGGCGDVCCVAALLKIMF